VPPFYQAFEPRETRAEKPPMPDVILQSFVLLSIYSAGAKAAPFLDTTPSPTYRLPLIIGLCAHPEVARPALFAAAIVLMWYNLLQLREVEAQDVPAAVAA
jgi:hypothetical protein